MSAWLKPLGLRDKLRIGTRESLKGSNQVPDWIGLLIWAGWWMRCTLVKGVRVFLVLLLPTRACCSSLCALGALIGSMYNRQGPLTWRQFVSLPTGTRVFLRLPDPKSRLNSVHAEGELDELSVMEDQITRKIRITAGKERITNSTLWIFEGNFRKYSLSLTPYRLRQRFDDVFQFYKALIPGLQSTSVLLISNECLLVTNRAAWKREVKGLLASTEKRSKQSGEYDLTYLLMLSEHDEVPCTGTQLCSAKSDKAGAKNIPLAILDGPDALKCWEMVKTPNIIVLLDQTEYDESLQGILSLISSVRNDKRLPVPEDIPPNPPPGVEMMMFALEVSEI